MAKFRRENLGHAYKMLKGDATSLIATKGNTPGLYNLTPIDWCMPMDYEPVTRLIFSCAPNHQCDSNIQRTKEFAVCIPASQSDPIIGQCGSISDPSANKFKLFDIKGVKAAATDLVIPAYNLKGWIECRLIRVIREGSVDLIMGEAVAAFIRQQEGLV